MAETLPSALEQELLGIKQLLWGRDIKHEIFKRWSQGFYFSQSEPTALEQAEGGPCAVIAPVQAFILKHLLLKYRDLSFRDKAENPEVQNNLLVNAVCEILEQCTSHKYYIVYLNNDPSENLEGTGLNGDNIENGNAPSKLLESELVDAMQFHENLRIHTFSNVDDVRKYYIENISQLKLHFGILLFLYSVIATRSLEKVKSDNSNDVQDSLIDDTYGYGSQCLINLMMTGRATTYVWDHEKDAGGLKLRGLEKQSHIGFITLMEHFGYCTVGSFYKNPINPVWVVGSDTHLTVIFSPEQRLVSPETKTDQARRVFKTFDPDGNNFIQSSLLANVLRELDLVSEEPYVEIMKKKLDPENLGIILLNAFMDEFFPKEENPVPDVFTLVHYNGLAQSNRNGHICYHIAECILLESDLRAVSESNPMLTVLQTKWPNIEIRWTDNVTPSLD